MSAQLPILHAQASRILSRTSGFIAQAGFTHSLSPARNCTFGCTYCYVPTLRIYGGLKQTDWLHWGQWTTFKDNAGALLRRELRREQIVYCSPLVDPYQPAEAQEEMMPGLLQILCEQPPAVFVIQTRSPLVLRDLPLLCELKRRTRLRVSFSLTTDNEEVRRRFEPHCAPLESRLVAIAGLRAAGIETFATLAPLLPGSPEALARAALSASGQDLIGDPLHLRAVKKTGATTRAAAVRVSEVHGYEQWLRPEFQEEVVNRVRAVAEAAGRRFAVGPEGFSWLAKT